MTFKVLRVARLFRIFRYIKAFNVLARAIRSKKNEMLVSLQFLCIITLMLSFILYFVEHEAQPEVYDNGWTSVIWAFAQYIGDPGGFAETPPITFWGRIIACIIGVLGIAIFAVPTIFISLSSVPYTFPPPLFLKSKTGHGVRQTGKSRIPKIIY